MSNLQERPASAVPLISQKPESQIINSTPTGTFMQGNKHVMMAGFRPQLREYQEDVSEAWEDAAGRAVDAIQNSGFLKGAVETVSSATVGSGLRPSFRPDHEALGWTLEEARDWGRLVERRFKAWAGDKRACDASGKFTFPQLQQAYFGAWMAYGEGLALLPLLKRTGYSNLTRVALIPPSRLSQDSDESRGLVQGVFTDGWGMPTGYRVKKKRDRWNWQDVDIPAVDKDGRYNVIHTFEPSIAVNRGITIFTPILKVIKQIDQVADSTVMHRLIQTIFTATVESQFDGVGAFDGLLTANDKGESDELAKYAETKGEWYKGAKIDLKEHGRIAHMLPGDSLKFNQANSSADDYDIILSWMMREIAMALGVTYDSISGDDREASYSSIRMSGAKEWLKVERRRENIMVPFCNAVAGAWLEEEILSGRIPYKGGLVAWEKERQFASVFKWSGPAKPQADDFKTARAFEVLKDINSTTLSAIGDEYGRDWDDDMYQRANENALADQLGLPRPWAPKDIKETPEGLDAELNASADNEKKETKPKRKKRGGTRSPGDAEPSGETETLALEAELEADLGN